MSECGCIVSVVRAGLCTSCGTCVAICPKNAVQMEETPDGLLLARVSTESCDSCGLCLRACGGSHLEPDILSAETDPFKGNVLVAYCGYATDPDIRLRGQSGGVVTALLSYLLDSGQVSKALVARMPEDGTLRPVPFLANEKSDLLGTQGSQYCPVPLNAAIPDDVGKDGENVAMVGLPCQIHSIRNAQRIHGGWKEGVGLTIGLFCDRTLSYGALDYLIGKGKVEPKDVATFRYRDKTQGGWPGTVYIRTKKNREILVPSCERMAIKEFFTPSRCRLCFDKMNVLSDIAVGDAWGVREGRDGFSVLLARTKSGLELLESVKNAGLLSLIEIDSEEVFLGQGIENRRIQGAGYTTVWREKGRVAPDYGLNALMQGKLGKDLALKPYRKQLDWVESLGKKTTRAQVLRTVKWHIEYKKIRSRLSLRRGLGSLIRRLVSKSRSL